MPQICVLISSSDNTADVLLQTLKSYQKYWKVSEFDWFVGLNNEQNKLESTLGELNIKPIYAKQPLGWANELQNQLKQLKQYDYVWLVLDDFFIKS